MGMCVFCELEALEGHLTCGMATCSESEARARAHSARRGHGGAGLVPAPSGAIEVRSRCGAVNGHMNLSCGLSPGHAGDVHRCGDLVWQAGARPRYASADDLARLGPVAAPTDTERLAQLTQVLLTARSQMLGLGEGLERALQRMVRPVDADAARGLIAALSDIVRTIDGYKVQPGDTALTTTSRIGSDRGTASRFDPKPPGGSRKLR